MDPPTNQIPPIHTAPSQLNFGLRLPPSPLPSKISFHHSSDNPLNPHLTALGNDLGGVFHYYIHRKCVIF